VLRGGSDVPFIIPEDFQTSMDCCCQHVSPDIEFSTVIEKEVLDIGLNNNLLVKIKAGLDLIQRRGHNDALPSI
jgi:hypothetical protein